jgi:hypothetical protein
MSREGVEQSYSYSSNLNLLNVTCCSLVNICHNVSGTCCLTSIFRVEKFLHEDVNRSSAENASSYLTLCTVSKREKFSGL